MRQLARYASLSVVSPFGHIDRFAATLSPPGRARPRATDPVEPYSTHSKTVTGSDNTIEAHRLEPFGPAPTSPTASAGTATHVPSTGPTP
jgi:hypothetical protein